MTQSLRPASAQSPSPTPPVAGTPDEEAAAWWAGYGEAAGWHDNPEDEDDGPTEAELANRLYLSDIRPLGGLPAAVTASAWMAATTSPTPSVGPHGQRGIPPIDASAWLRLGQDGCQRMLDVAHHARAFLNNETGSSAGQRQAGMRAELKRIVQERCGDEAVALLDAVLDASIREPDGGGVETRIARSTVAAARFATLAYSGALVAAAELNSRVKRDYPWLPVDEHGEVLVWRGTRPGAA